jgi:hypothetical protein
LLISVVRRLFVRRHGVIRKILLPALATLLVSIVPEVKFDMFLGAAAHQVDDIGPGRVVHHCRRHAFVEHLSP